MDEINEVNERIVTVPRKTSELSWGTMEIILRYEGHSEEEIQEMKEGKRSLPKMCVMVGRVERY